jgi:phenylpropionate dioxygenase-like ring-hydroxylating dioxygenase large terminal subunit
MSTHGIEAALELLATGAATADEAQALPFAAYTDEKLFALEADRVFHGDWVAVCAEAALADPGDYLSFDIAGEPLALIRGADGQLRALSNVCRHRGTLTIGPGVDCLEKGAITCPYHAWSYGDDGAFRGAPYTHGVTIDREEHSLPAFRIEVWMGVVFVCLSPDAPPLTERLAGIGPHLAEFAELPPCT